MNAKTEYTFSDDGKCIFHNTNIFKCVLSNIKFTFCTKQINKLGKYLDKTFLITLKIFQNLGKLLFISLEKGKYKVLCLKGKKKTFVWVKL